MPRKCTQEKLSMEPILQDFSVSSITDIKPDVFPPSDSSLMITVADYEVEVANMSSNYTLSSASYPADSTIMENIQNKPEKPLFKKPFNVKNRKKPRPSLFDLDMKDSEPDTPEQIVRRPFQRKKRGCLKASVLENESFSKYLNFSNEDVDLLNCSQNLCTNKTSENDDSLKKSRVFRRQKANHAKRISAVFDDVFEQSSDNSSSNISPVTNKTSEHCQVEDQGKDNQKVPQPLNTFPENTNFITRGKARQKKFIESKMFDKDILTSESDESFSSKPAFKRHPVVKEIQNTTIFDNALEVSTNNNLSITKSPALKRLPFKTSKRSRVKDLPGFDSLINESLNKSENQNAMCCDIFTTTIVKEHTDDSIYFDDALNNTCDGSSLMSNSFANKEKSSEEEEETNLPVEKTIASIDSSQLGFNKQIGLDISNKTEELNIINSMDLPNVEINNKTEIGAVFVKNIQEFSIPTVVQESNENINEFIVNNFTKEFSIDTTKKNNPTLTFIDNRNECVQLVNCEKYQSSESSNTSTRFNAVEKVNGGLENAEANSSQITLLDDYEANLGSFSQDEQMVTHKENELKHSLQSNIKELTKDTLAAESRVLNYSLDLSNPDLQCETSNNKSIIKTNKMTFSVSETENSQAIQEEPNFFQVHSLNAKSNKSDISESPYCKYDNNSDRCLKSAEQNDKSLASISKIKKQSVKRVSFKLRNEVEERTSYRNSALNNTYLEGKSHSKSDQSHTSNTACSFESLVFDGSSSEITSGSFFIDLCASRNKSSSVNMNVENNSYDVENKNNKSLVVQPLCEKIDKSMEKEQDKELGEDTSEDLVDKAESGLEENEEENVEIDQLGGEGRNIVQHCEEISKSKETEKGVTEVDEHSLEDLDDNLEPCLEDKSVNVEIEQLDYEVRDVIEDNEGRNERIIEDFLVDKQILHERTKDRSIHYYQFKKPGPCTVFNEQTSTPPSKRKVQEMLAKMPLSEFKCKKSKPVAVDLTKEQIEQDQIEEMLRKRQTQRSVRSTKTPKLTKPKYMSPKVYDLIIEKLTPSFGIKSRIQAETVVKLLNEQVDVIMKKESHIVQPVQKMKLTLANYKIIRTHWDFYKFIINFSDGYFSQKVYPSGVVSPHEPDNPLEDVL